MSTGDLGVRIGRGPGNRRRRDTGSRCGPLRAVVGGFRDPGSSSDYDVLECGHNMRAAHDIYGRTLPKRRRCKRCRAEADVQPVPGHTVPEAPAP